MKLPSSHAPGWLSFAVLCVSLALACSGDPTAARRTNSGPAPVAPTQPGATPDAGGFGNSNHASTGSAGQVAADGGHVAADGGDGCGSVSVEAKRDVHPGSMLVVFDQSQTMGDEWIDASGQSAPKYAVASASLVAAVQPIVDKLNAGAIFLPTTAADGLDLCTAQVAPLDMAPQIAIAPGAMFLPEWQSHFATDPLLLGTPLNKALHEADVALMPPPTGTTVIVIFTDGQWTCEDGSETTTVAALFSRGIKTYVVGLPGARDATGLDTLAKAGGTTAADCSSNCFLLPTDAGKLQEALTTIAQVAAGFDTCSFSIAGKLVDQQRACSTGSVTIDAGPIACDAQNGFSVDDATHISFHGAACDQLKSSGVALKANFPCDVVVVE